MSNIIINKKVVDDLIKGKANYIKRKWMEFDQISFGQKEITFENRKGKVLATIILPNAICFDLGETVTVQFSGSMKFHLE
jgi:hypothetical protein